MYRAYKSIGVVPPKSWRDEVLPTETVGILIEGNDKWRTLIQAAVRAEMCKGQLGISSGTGPTSQI